MESQHQHIDYELLITRYLSGEITHKEREQLNHWLEQNQGNREILRQFEKTWDVVDYNQTKAKINIEDEWNTFLQKRNAGTKRSPRTRFMHSPLLKIAAVFVAGLIIASTVLYLYTRPVQYATAHATKTIELQDGSQVILNKHSVLKVHSFKLQNSRQLSLQGEAFFEVKDDPQKPFRVKTDQFTVTVLGTSFNVKAYDKTQYPYVVVNSGQVSVGNNTETIELQAGDKAELDPENKKLIKQVNTDVNYLSWKTHIFEFNNDPLLDVVKALNAVYDETIVLKNDNLKDCKITARFEKQSIQSILEVLSSMLNVEIKEQDETITISGTGC